MVIGIDDTASSGAGGRKSGARGIYLRSGPVLRRDTSSRPAACAGCPRSCSSTYPGSAVSWACRSSPCLHRPSASMRTSRAHPRHCWTGLVRLHCRSTAGCNGPPDCHRRRHCVRRGRFPRCRPEIMSASSPDCASTPISMPPHHPDDRAADDRRSRAKRLPTLTQVLHDAGTVWQRHTVTLSGMAAPIVVVEIATGTAVWCTVAARPLCRFAGCWCAIGSANYRPQEPSSAPISTPPLSISSSGSSRVGSWRLPSRRSVPISASKTQRQWSDLAIMRTTPALLGLFSLVALWAPRPIAADTPLVPATAA